MVDPADETELPKDPAKPTPLDYSPPPVPSSSGGILAMASFASGFVMAVGVSGCLGAIWYANVKPIGGPSTTHPSPPLLPILTFAAIAIAAVIGIVLTTRQIRAGIPRWYLLGLLVGVGVTALLEGICFRVG